MNTETIKPDSLEDIPAAAEVGDYTPEFLEAEKILQDYLEKTEGNLKDISPAELPAVLQAAWDYWQPDYEDYKKDEALVDFAKKIITAQEKPADATLTADKKNQLNVIARLKEVYHKQISHTMKPAEFNEAVRLLSAFQEIQRATDNSEAVKKEMKALKNLDGEGFFAFEDFTDLLLREKTHNVEALEKLHQKNNGDFHKIENNRDLLAEYEPAARLIARSDAKIPGLNKNLQIQLKNFAGRIVKRFDDLEKEK